VPQDYVNAGRIILNISPKSCRGLHLDNDRILFTTRFSGQTMQLFLHPHAVLAIYAKENGRGMEFGEEYNEPPPPPVDIHAGSSSRSRGKPVLKLVE
jgi:stringent starvation protein B